MDDSALYIELQAMIEKNWLVKSLTEFAEDLNQFQHEGWITAAERQSLLEFYLENAKKMD
jgi:hypothetical protein